MHFRYFCLFHNCSINSQMLFKTQRCKVFSEHRKHEKTRRFFRTLRRRGAKCFLDHGKHEDFLDDRLPFVLWLTLDYLVSAKNNYQSTLSLSNIFYQELEKFELMRRREDCYLRSIWNGRDWQERKRPFSNSHQFKNFSLIL